VKVLPARRLAPVSTAPGSFSTGALTALTPSAPTPLALSPPALGDRVGSIREDYFAGARELLAEQGSDAVTTRTLADHLGLTKGSFRHHFGSMLEFQEALADHWEAARTDRLILCRAERNPWRRLEMLLTDLLIRPEPAEIVWRAWGHANPIVGGALRRVDQQFESVLAGTLAQLCADDDPGLLAEMTLGFALGLHHWYPTLDPELMARAAIEWAHRFLRIDARLTNAPGHPALVFARR
jgi:AcrR family transcriptional regulator